MTQEELKRMMRYCPDTGVFIWLRGNGKAVKEGDIVGSYARRSGYRKTKLKHKQWMLHRLAFLYMTGSLPREQVDHINGVKDDNRWSNLRAVSQYENGLNQKKSVLNKSGVPGVCLHKSSGKWQASIWVLRKFKYIGLYENFSEAVTARKSAESLYGYHVNHGR
jgi:hypothetical protein